MPRVEIALSEWSVEVRGERLAAPYRDLDPIEATLTEVAEAALKSLIASSGNRVDVPIRNTFARSDGEGLPPLAVLASRGGRGGAGLAIKLYIALIWRCSSGDFATQLPARLWARLLDLPSPDSLGSRRVKDALNTLSELRLIRLEAVRGAASKVTLLREDGNGTAYSVPSDAYRQAGTKEEKSQHQYFKVPQALWTSGHMQALSTPALVMLLILLEEIRSPDAEQWWSVTEFDRRFRISKDVRAKGTKELVARGLLLVTRMSLPSSPSAANQFAPESVRNKYALLNEARAKETQPVAGPAPTARGKTKRPPTPKKDSGSAPDASRGTARPATAV